MTRASPSHGHHDVLAGKFDRIAASFAAKAKACEQAGKSDCARLARQLAEDARACAANHRAARRAS